MKLGEGSFMEEKKMAVAQGRQLYYVPTVTSGDHGTFTAVCEEFGLAASGSTASEARDRLQAIVVSLCNALRRNGTLEKALKESGMRSEPFDRAEEEDRVTIAA